jgi:hypothetical protein
MIFAARLYQINIGPSMECDEQIGISGGWGHSRRRKESANGFGVGQEAGNMADGGSPIQEAGIMAEGGSPIHGTHGFGFPKIVRSQSCAWNVGPMSSIVGHGLQAGCVAIWSGAISLMILHGFQGLNTQLSRELMRLRSITEILEWHCSTRRRMTMFFIFVFV